MATAKVRRLAKSLPACESCGDTRRQQNSIANFLTHPTPEHPCLANVEQDKGFYIALLKCLYLACCSPQVVRTCSSSVLSVPSYWFGNWSINFAVRRSGLEAGWVKYMERSETERAQVSKEGDELSNVLLGRDREQAWCVPLWCKSFLFEYREGVARSAVLVIWNFCECLLEGLAKVFWHQGTDRSTEGPCTLQFLSPASWLEHPWVPQGNFLEGGGAQVSHFVRRYNLLCALTPITWSWQLGTGATHVNLSGLSNEDLPKIALQVVDNKESEMMKGRRCHIPS